MAFAADQVGPGLEVRAARGLDLVGRVALDADGTTGIALGQELAVDALLVDRLHGDVALAAGLRHVGMVDGRAAVHAALDVVDAVAVVAAGGHDEALLEQRLAMDALGVLSAHRGVLHLVFVGDALVGVALPAGDREVHLVDRRIGQRDPADVVVPVAIDAVGGGRGAHGPAHAVDAALVDLGLVRVAGAAVHLGHLAAVARMILMDVRVAALAGQRGVHGLAEPFSVHEQGDRGPVRPVLDHVLVAMAGEAGLVGLVHGGGSTEGRHRQEDSGEEGEQEAAPTASAGGAIQDSEGRSVHGVFL